MAKPISPSRPRAGFGLSSAIGRDQMDTRAAPIKSAKPPKNASRSAVPPRPPSHKKTR